MPGSCRRSLGVSEELSRPVTPMAVSKEARSDAAVADVSNWPGPALREPRAWYTATWRSGCADDCDWLSSKARSCAKDACAARTLGAVDVDTPLDERVV